MCDSVIITLLLTLTLSSKWKNKSKENKKEILNEEDSDCLYITSILSDSKILDFYTAT